MYKKSENVIDHSQFNIEEEINKFLKNGGVIEQVTHEPKFKSYKRKNINIEHSVEQNSNE
jgi:hypothetical protein